MNKDETFIKRCITLAHKGIGSVSPNPLVGSVIVHNNEIIGEGYHQKFGDHHAEVNAIASVTNQHLLKESTLYVNLEPCAHHGKTPPCTDLIIEKQIQKVVIGSTDPFHEVDGKGILKLKNAGIEVIVNTCVVQCDELNKRFITFHKKNRPYIILKWAQSEDGYLDSIRTNSDEVPATITCDKANILTHSWRAQEDAILIGNKTAILDKPSLNVRHVSGKDPLRIVLDASNRLNLDNRHLQKDIQSLIYNTKTDNKAGIFEWKKIDTKNFLGDLMNDLKNRNISSVIVEGGSITLNSFIKENFWDEARVYTGALKLSAGVIAPLINTSHSEQLMVGNTRLTIYHNT